MKIDYLESSFNDFKDKSLTGIQVWRNVRIIDTIANEVIFADGCYCKGSVLGHDVLLNKGCFILNSNINDKSQIGFNTKVLYATIGKCISI